MSETAKAKLRAINEAGKARIAANAALIEQFKQLPKDCSTMKRFLLRLCAADSVERRAIKLRYALSHGWVPTAELGATGFLFLSELSDVERKMSDETFLSSLTST